MAKVAVIGSRITRDLWPPKDRDAANLIHISQTSLPSLLSPPPADLADAPGPADIVSRDAYAACEGDLRKTSLTKLMAFRPSHIVLDLFDERFDLMAVGGCIVTRSRGLEQSGYLERPPLSGARRVPRLSVTCDRLWNDAAREFAELVASTPLSVAALVLHVSRWPAGVDAEALDPGAHNTVLAGYEAQLCALFPDMKVVNPPDSLRVAAPGRTADGELFRFAPAYEAEARRQFAELGLPTA